MLPAARPDRATRRRLRFALVPALAVALGACGSAPAITPLPSGAPLPTDCASADGSVITLAADNLDYSAPCMVAPADAAFTIAFTDDEGVPHNLALYDTPAKVNEYFRGDPITGPGQTIDYPIDALQAGDYYFVCTIHPGDMRGTLYVR